MATNDRRQAGALNSHMVETLVAGCFLRSPGVEAAFRSVLRHHFLPGTPLEEVYSGRTVVTRRGPDGAPTSSSSDLRVMAGMLEQLDVQPGHHVLEVGAGTGYNAALLRHLCGEDGSVTTVDIDPAVTAAAVENLRRGGFDGVSVLTGDGWAAVPSEQPFDRIVATVGVWDLSPAWINQLRPGGLLEAPLWLRAGLQASIVFRKTEDGLHSLSVEPCAFMRLRGLGAGPESYARIGRWTVNLDNERPGDVVTLRRLLDQPRRSEGPPALRAGWFNGIALSDPDVIMLADWESRVTLTGLFDSGGPSLAVVESDCRTSEPVPERIHAYGTNDALARLTMLIDRTPPIALADMEIEVVPHGAFADDERMVARLARPNGDLVITRARS